MLRQRFVLDTSALTDSATREKEGYKTLCEGINSIMDIIAEARLSYELSCYIPYP
ncbi:MAG: RNA ligase partner protein, partial [Methanosarcinales archaeon]|nr:RNA ligase partner protein [Methanosarcinales archaeon]